MRACTAAEVRAMDQETIATGVSGFTLMQRAARGAAERVIHLLRLKGLAHARVLVAAGKGNNGGDGVVVAALLHEAGWDVCVWLAGRADALKGEAAEAWAFAQDRGVPLLEKPEESDWSPDAGRLPLVDIVVDALLGTGQGGAPHGVVAAAIRALRPFSPKRVIALDVPSGMDADTGEAGDVSLSAQWTLTFGAPKTGLLTPAGAECAGSVDVIPLAYPDAVASHRPEGGSPTVITRGEVLGLVPSRSAGGHKGTYGHVLVIGGSQGFSGAVVLAARAALRSGAGLVSVITPESMVDRIASATPEIMVHPGAENGNGGLHPDALRAYSDLIDRVDCILIGPGMGAGSDSMTLARGVFMGVKVPVVVDADGLNCFAARPQWFSKAQAPLVLTPHPGEAARLMSCEVSQIQMNRDTSVAQLAEDSNATVVLKGSRTLLQAPGGHLWVNVNGNPGMASGGVGDALGGMIAALIGQGCSPFDASLAGVYLHGLAGDLSAWKRTRPAVTAMNIVEEIPNALHWTGVY